MITFNVALFAFLCFMTFWSALFTVWWSSNGMQNCMIKVTWACIFGANVYFVASGRILTLIAA